MSRRGSVTLIIILGLSLSIRAQTGDVTTLRKCVGALNAFDGLIGTGKSGVGPDWVKGTRGWVLLNSSVPPPASELRAFIGDTKDISSCAALGVEPTGIQLFLMAFHGYLPVDPFEDVSSCTASLTVAGPEIERVLGGPRAQAFGFALGKKSGVVVGQLGYIWPAKKRTIQQVQARAASIAASLAALPPEKRWPAVKARLFHCELYNIPLAAVLDGAGVVIK